MFALFPRHNNREIVEFPPPVTTHGPALTCCYLVTQT